MVETLELRAHVEFAISFRIWRMIECHGVFTSMGSNDGVLLHFYTTYLYQTISLDKDFIGSPAKDLVVVQTIAIKIRLKEDPNEAPVKDYTRGPEFGLRIILWPRLRLIQSLIKVDVESDSEVDLKMDLQKEIKEDLV